MSKGMNQQKLAVKSGYWPLYRYDPRLIDQGKNPFQLDSKKPSIPLTEYAYNETRYKMLLKSNPDRAKHLMDLAQKNVYEHWNFIENMSKNNMVADSE